MAKDKNTTKDKIPEEHFSYREDEDEEYEPKYTKKRHHVMTAVFYILILALAALNLFLFMQNKKYMRLYENQLSVNSQLEAIIESQGTESAEEENIQDDLPIVAGEAGTEISADESNPQTIDAKNNRGYYSDIPSSVKKQTEGNSMGSDSPVIYDELAYLTVPYYNYNGEIAVGHIIVARDLADEVLDIFSELVRRQYPIESMEIIEDFDDKQTNVLNTAETAARGNNNTFGFFYRKSYGSFVKNSYGRGLEINPKVNPTVNADGTTTPKNAVKYTDRSISPEGAEKWSFIRDDSEIVELFASKGWKWGGADGGTDYCHFEK